MRIFVLIWLGQIISLVGSDLTEFALGVWAYQKTGSVTQFALISLFMYLPQIIISPLAGALVDRWDRRLCMILSDSVAAINTLIIFWLILSGQLQIWHLYIVVAISSIFTAFQWPAYSAAITQLVPKQNLSRANGMVQASRAAAKIIAPIFAGLLVKTIHLEGIIFLDLLSFSLALGTLLFVRFPQIPLRQSQVEKIGNISQLQQEIISGWHYISHRKGLLGLLLLFGVIYFTEGILQVVFWPLILNFADGIQLGIVLSIAGCGMLLGSLIMSIWGGPPSRIKGILFFMALQGAFLCLGGLQVSIVLAAIGAFGYLFAYPFVVSCNRTIWQNKIPLDLQGRVFALQLMLEKSLAIIAYSISGPLVDYLLEPLLAPQGLLANSIGKIIGVGPGRGIGLLFILLGILNILIAIGAYQQPRIRRIEKELPEIAYDNCK